MWIDEIYPLIVAGRIDDAMDVVFQGFDDLFLAGKFDEADMILDQLDVERMDIQLMSGVLAATCVAKDKLSQRKHFAAKVRARLTEIAPDRVERLMEGHG